MRERERKREKRERFYHSMNERICSNPSPFPNHLKKRRRSDCVGYLRAVETRIAGSALDSLCSRERKYSFIADGGLNVATKIERKRKREKEKRRKKVKEKKEREREREKERKKERERE